MRKQHIRNVYCLQQKESAFAFHVVAVIVVVVVAVIVVIVVVNVVVIALVVLLLVDHILLYAIATIFDVPSGFQAFSALTSLKPMRSHEVKMFPSRVVHFQHSCFRPHTRGAGKVPMPFTHGDRFVTESSWSAV